MLYLRIIPVVFLLAFCGISTADESDKVDIAVEIIKKKVHMCINDNLRSLTRLQDCTAVAEQALKNYPASNSLNWSFAEMVRRELGNQISLKYFKSALKDNITPENCIHDGMDFAVKVGLDLPYDSFKRDATIATDIVFKYCWSEFKEELVALSKRNPSSYWLENVCRGADQYKLASAFSNCGNIH